MSTEPQIDLTGKKIDYLTVLGRTGKSHRSRGIIWKCQCDCGNICEKSTSALNNKKSIKSCGCMHRTKDLTGQRFGSLTVVKRAKDDNGVYCWLCQCDCGNTCLVPTARLTSNHRTSCGCGIHYKEQSNISSGCVDGTKLSALKQKTRCNSKSGIKGVYWNKQLGKWDAAIRFKGKRYFLGSYFDLRDAARARRIAERALFDPCLKKNGRTPTNDREFHLHLKDAIKNAVPDD